MLPPPYAHSPLLGTVVVVTPDVGVGPEAARIADRADQAVVDEVQRLESVFSAFDSGSELRRWARGEVPLPSAEFAEVLDAALRWQVRSEGRYNPLVGELTQLWKRAETVGEPPDPHELSQVAASIRTPRFGGSPPTPTGDCAGLNLNAIAKGSIVDRAVAHALTAVPELLALTVNAGGDLRHSLGPNGPAGAIIEVGVENPLRPYDNEPPLCRIALGDEAVATSGQVRRGFRIGGVWHGHCLDPRTGDGTNHLASITVIAASALIADVLATVLSTMEPHAAVDPDTAAGLGAEGAGVFVVTAEGAQLSNAAFEAHRVG